MKASLSPSADRSCERWNGRRGLRPDDVRAARDVSRYGMSPGRPLAGPIVFVSVMDTSVGPMAAQCLREALEEAR